MFTRQRAPIPQHRSRSTPLRWEKSSQPLSGLRSPPSLLSAQKQLLQKFDTTVLATVLKGRAATSAQGALVSRPQQLLQRNHSNHYQILRLKVKLLSRHFATEGEKPPANSTDAPPTEEAAADMDEEELEKLAAAGGEAKKKERKTFPFYSGQHPWENDERYDGLFPDPGNDPNRKSYPVFARHLSEEENQKRQREHSQSTMNQRQPSDKVLDDLFRKSQAKWTRRFWLWVVTCLQGLFLYELYKFIFSEDDWKGFFAFVPWLNWLPALKLADASPNYFWLVVLILGVRRQFKRLVGRTMDAQWFRFARGCLYLIGIIEVYRNYRLALHYDVETLLGTFAAPLMYTLYVCNADQYIPIGDDHRPPRSRAERNSIFRFMINAGERSVRAVETEEDQSWLQPLYATVYMFIRPWIPGFSAYVKESRELGRLIARGQLEPSDIELPPGYKEDLKARESQTEN